jgi:murein DD-endopeptidase MepM/ murein hydrolase activator NlpD
MRVRETIINFLKPIGDVLSNIASGFGKLIKNLTFGFVDFIPSTVKWVTDKLVGRADVEIAKHKEEKEQKEKQEKDDTKAPKLNSFTGEIDSVTAYSGGESTETSQGGIEGAQSTSSSFGDVTSGGGTNVLGPVAPKNKVTSASSSDYGSLNYEAGSEEDPIRKAMVSALNQVNLTGEYLKNNLGMGSGSGGGTNAYGNTVINPLIGDVGLLSAKYESGGKAGAGVIADNKGDIGGKSYGTFQLSKNKGTLDSFMKYMSENYNPYYKNFEGLETGSAEFDTVWKDLALKDGANFGAMQEEFVMKKFYEPVVQNILRDTGIDISKKSTALKNVAFSVAIQHGTGTSLFKNAGISNNMTEEQMINAIYNERQKVDKYFSKSSKDIQQSVFNRFTRERQDALDLLKTNDTSNFDVGESNVSNLRLTDKAAEEYFLQHVDKNFKSVSAKYGNVSDVHKTAHGGIDFPAPQGAGIPAPISGKVIYNGPMRGYGTIVVVEDVKGMHHIFGHVSKSYVKKGDIVKQGSIIAAVGGAKDSLAEGEKSSGPHLHYEIRKKYGDNTTDIDPNSYLKEYYNQDARNYQTLDAIKRLEEKATKSSGSGVKSDSYDKDNKPLAFLENSKKDISEVVKDKSLFQKFKEKIISIKDKIFGKNEKEKEENRKKIDPYAEAAAASATRLTVNNLSEAKLENALAGESWADKVSRMQTVDTEMNYTAGVVAPQAMNTEMDYIKGITSAQTVDTQMNYIKGITSAQTVDTKTNYTAGVIAPQTVDTKTNYTAGVIAPQTVDTKMGPETSLTSASKSSASAVFGSPIINLNQIKENNLPEVFLGKDRNWVLSELGRQQWAWYEYQAIGRPDLAVLANVYANKLRKYADLSSFDITTGIPKNKYGHIYTDFFKKDLNVPAGQYIEASHLGRLKAVGLLGSQTSIDKWGEVIKKGSGFKDAINSFIKKTDENLSLGNEEKSSSAEVAKKAFSASDVSSESSVSKSSIESVNSMEKQTKKASDTIMASKASEGMDSSTNAFNTMIKLLESIDKSNKTIAEKELKVEVKASLDEKPVTSTNTANNNTQAKNMEEDNKKENKRTNLFTPILNLIASTGSDTSQMSNVVLSSNISKIAKGI